MSDAPAGYRLHDKGAALHCANCFGQYTDRRYVELPAAFDGPVVNQLAKVYEAGVDAIAIDDLVLCEECLTHAAGLVGLTRAPELVEQVLALQADKADLERRLADSDRALGDMHAAQRSLVQRRQGHPRKPENVPDPGREPVPG